jgi:phosphoribosyl-ATP pyrophosphohydrolase/phosphoribosyl-AMP cyclohydrolase
MAEPLDDLAFAPDGLLPAIVQDAADGRVLMLAWMDAEALAATLATGEVHFHSRSRDRLWRKGETSGNILRVGSIAPDCDRDALLVTATPAGPTCHRGTQSCFDGDLIAAESGTATPAKPQAVAEPSSPAGSVGSESAPRSAGEAAPRPSQDFYWLEELWATIASRAAERPAGSYTTSLLDAGVDAVARKVSEEATEVLLAAKDDATAEGKGEDRAATRAAVAAESADLLFHALVLLAERDVPPSEVIAELRARAGRKRGAHEEADA